MAALQSLSLAEGIFDALGQSDYERDFLIYQCGYCLQILFVSKSEVSEVIQTALTKNCPDCGLPISRSLTCRSIRASFETSFWSHPAFSLETRSERVYPVKFSSAYSLLGLSSGVAFVDNLIGNLTPNTIALIEGQRIPTQIAQTYCIRAQLDKESGELGGGSAFFLDGGNSFDVYLFTSIAREYEFDLNRALERIVVSRAFTPYELLQLVSKDASQVFEAYHPRLLVVSDIFNLLTQDIEEDEGIRIMERVGVELRKINKERQVPIVITAMKRANHLEFLFKEYCNIIAEFSEGINHARLRLLKHPTKAPLESVQELTSQPYNQKLLFPLRSIVNG
jgi:predicted RNA-binding Zn-ribbon protein involved in translation (DUF1610 family)